MASEAVVFREPEGASLALSERPRLASWDAKTHPSQVALTRYLDSVESLIGARKLPPADLALRLTVGLARETSLTERGNDLDNFLYPLIHRLGAHRFLSVWGEKRIAEDSGVTVDEAEPGRLDDLREWKHASVRTSSSASTVAWKEEIALQLQDTRQLSSGPVELQISFRVSPQRNWSTLWKPAIDSLGTILGEDRIGRSFHPQDDRVVVLALHRVVDASVQYDVGIDFWWRMSS
jgi:hypothetical protein